MALSFQMMVTERLLSPAVTFDIERFFGNNVSILNWVGGGRGKREFLKH